MCLKCCGRPGWNWIRCCNDSAEITRQIGTVKQAIIGLGNVFGGPVLQEAILELMDHRTTNRQSGFSRACRYVLTEANRPLNSSEMCEELRKKFPGGGGAA